MALDFDDLFDRVKPYDGLRPSMIKSSADYGQELLGLISYCKADGISLYALLQTATDQLEEYENQN